MMFIAGIFMFIKLIAPANALAMESAYDACEKRVARLVFIAGPNDHCTNKPCHLYIEDLTLLKDCIESFRGDLEFEVDLYIGERPEVGSLDDAAAVIIHSSGDRSKDEWHALFPQNLDEDGYDDAYMDFLSYFDEQMARGMGLMVLHYSTWVDHPSARKRYLQWLGGYYQDGRSGVDGDRSTKGTTAIETVEFADKNHPILNGVKPWTTEAEYYYNMYFEDKGENFFPILKSALPIDDPELHTIAWGVERADGGRGFSFTGAHFHNNMYLEDFRKFLLNAIVWVAGEEVPGKGVDSNVKKDYRR